jgi:hypothetical protein
MSDPQSRSGARLLAGGRRSLPLIVVLAGVALLGAAGLIWWRSQPAPNVGTATVTQLGTAATPAAGGPVVPVQPGLLPSSGAELAPVKLALPKLGVTATVVPTGVDGSGQFDVPPSVDTVGWYRFGPGLSASGGSIVVGGHVDSATQGAGAFFRLRDLAPGDTVTVTGADGGQRRFRVLAREEYPKTAIDLTRYFTWSGELRLTLITCGGKFDPATRHYRDNVVVTAAPIP